MNNNRIYGFNRDKLIVEIVEKCKCLDAEQIELLFFRNTCNPTSAKIQCQNRLRKLTDKKLLNRWRMDLDEPYKYYINEFAQKEHTVLLNWMLIKYIIDHPYDKIYHVEYQRDYKILVPDLFLITFNQFNKEQQYKAIMFEMDKTISNKFDKIEKYNKLFESKPNDEYVRLTAPRFPKIIIATTEKSRLKEIDRLIQNEKLNKNNLRFETELIWDVKERCKDEKIEGFRNKFIYDYTPIRICLS
jgi:hypothetical protein